jgi:hypothetical protein
LPRPLRPGTDLQAGNLHRRGDESGFWLDFIARIELATPPAVKPLSGEANELVAIFTAGQKTTRRKMEEKKAKRAPKRES